VKAKIYTKTGDKGQTSLVGGTRVDKTDVRLEAYGTLDELNSVLGVLRSNLGAGDFPRSVERSLRVIQNNLFNLGSRLACEDEKLRSALPSLSAGAVESLEKEMDLWEGELPALRNFILPGGSTLAAYAHLARTVSRRAERAALRVTAGVDAGQLVYLNRLSDWFFLLARKFNQVANVEDVLWEKG